MHHSEELQPTQTQYPRRQRRTNLPIQPLWVPNFLLGPALNAQQNANLLTLKPWFTQAAILKMVTHDNAELLQMSGLRSLHPAALGCSPT